MPLQEDRIFAILPDEYPRVVEVWEASVRATHDFVTEADITAFRPIVRDALPRLEVLVGVRSDDGEVAGFLGANGHEVEMLFIHPAFRGQGGGTRLLDYAVDILGATMLDVNEQNPQALGFYLARGFEVVGRSERDGLGKPYPLLHMRWRAGQGGGQGGGQDSGPGTQQASEPTSNPHVP